MSRTKAFNYFDAYKKQADYAREMALNLKSALETNEIGTKPLMDALHTIENDADHVNHQIQSHLEADFVVPLERTGMCALAHAMDDVNDALEDIAIKAYMYNCRVIAPEGPKMIALIAEACTHLATVVDQLRAERDRLQQYLADRGIQTMIHYPIPPHHQKCYREWASLSLPITERIHREELSIPLNQTLTDDEVATIIRALNEF